MNVFSEKDWLNSKVLEHLPGNRKFNGSDVNFRCPYCLDSRKSKTKMRGHYYLKTSTYYCFNCDFSCSAIYLLSKIASTDYDNIKREYIKQKFNYNSLSLTSLSSNTLSSNESILDQYNKSIIPENWKNPLSDRAYEYLNNRLVLDSPFLDGTRFYSCYDKKENEYILIPWVINGIEAYYQINDYLKHNSDDKKYIFPYNSDKLLFGLDNIDTSFKYIICFEGVYDSLFVKNGISIGGKKLTAVQKKLISERYPYHKIVMAFDNDKPGDLATLKSISENNKIKIFRWYRLNNYNKFKDINDLIKDINDVNIFTNYKIVEKYIDDPIIVKMDLMKKLNL